METSVGRHLSLISKLAQAAESGTTRIAVTSVRKEVLLYFHSYFVQQELQLNVYHSIGSTCYALTFNVFQSFYN